MRTREPSAMSLSSGPRARIPAQAIVIAGPPASGKSTLAGHVAGELGYAIVDLDAVTGALTRAALELCGLDETALDAAAGHRLRTARYASLLAVAVENLGIGAGVVLAAPFTSEVRDGEAWGTLERELLAAGAGQVLLVQLRCRPALRAERLRARGAGRDAAKPPPRLPDALPAADLPGLVLDAEMPLDDQLAALGAALGDRVNGSLSRC